MHNLRCFLLVIPLFFLSITQGVAMTIFGIGEKCAASEINVVVTRDGKPLVGAAVQRSVKWMDVGREVDTTTTDENGAFHFPAKYMFSLKHNMFPLEMVSTTLIYVEVDGVMQKIIVAIKRYHTEGVEYGGHRHLRCEINDEPRFESFNASIIETRCRWD